MDKFNEHGGGDETVKNVYDEMTGWEHHTWMSSTDHEYIESLATRALAAHNREMAAKDAEIAALNEKLTLHDCFADEECEDADAARICAEDEAARLRALVKDMADELDMVKPKICVGCPASLCSIAGEPCEVVKYTNALVARAREVIA